MSPNAYYNYKKHRKDAREKNKASTLKSIEKIYHESNGRPGYRMMQILLKNAGVNLSVQTVRKYMNVELDLKSVTRKRKYRHSKSAEAYEISQNLIEQNFFAEHRNQKWCIDFTYIYFGKTHKRYNCTIIDLYDRSVIASVNGAKINTKLAIATVEKAISRCGGIKEVVLHSDRGSQFTSKEFIEYCKSNSIKQSMSKSGYPYDNSPMERYFNTLKSELLYLYDYDDEESLYEDINCFAYGWYNCVRPHTFNGGLPPQKVK